MKIDRKTLIIFAAPFVLAVIAAYVEWAITGLPPLPAYTTFDAGHSQTILAYEMNFQPLGRLHGAPLRLRVENQLGFKMVKWIRAIEFVDDVKRVEMGEGGYNEDHEYFGELANI